MAGLVMGLTGGLDLSGRAPPPRPDEPIRIHPLGPSEAFAIAPHVTLGAVALHLIHGNGENSADQLPADSLGAPFGGWRMRGFRILPSVDSNPVNDAVQIVYDGVGSQQTAINIGNVYGGDYHGGKRGAVQHGTLLSDTARAARLELIERYDIEWPGGAVAALTQTLRLDPDGSVTTVNRAICASDTLTVSLALPMFSTAFTRMSLDGGVNWTDITVAETYPADADEIWFRDPVTGLIAIAGDDARQQHGFDEKYVNRNAGRVKLYSRFDAPAGGPLGDVTCTAYRRFAGSAPDPVAAWSPFVDMFDGAGIDTPAEWVRTHPSAGQPGPSSVGGGVWTITGVANQPNRWVRTPGNAIPPGRYLVEAIYSAPDGTAGAIQVDDANTGAGQPLASGSFATAATTTTLQFQVEVPAGSAGFIRVSASLVAGRRTIINEVRMTPV